MAHQPEQLRGPSASGSAHRSCTSPGRGGLAGTGLTLQDLYGFGFRIVADPVSALLAGYAAWQQTYANLANDFGASAPPRSDWSSLEHDMLGVIGLEKLLEIERRTVER